MWDPRQPWSRGSYNRPVPIPTLAPGDAPLLCLAVNAEWMQYVMGSLKQLMLPDTWGDAADPLVQAAQAAANDLIAIFAEATPCGAADVAGTYTADCLAADVGLAANTPTTVCTLTVDPGEYLLMANVQVKPLTTIVDVTVTLWDGATLLTTGETTPKQAGYSATVSLNARVSPAVATTYTLNVEADGAGLEVYANPTEFGTGANLATCLRAYPQGISGLTGPEGPPGPATQVRFTAGCGLEYSTDSGATWLAVPGWLDNAASCFAGFDGGTIPAGRIDPGSPPTIGDGTIESRACNISAYLAQVVLRGALNKAQSDAGLTKTALEFGAGLAGLVLGFGIGDVLFVAAAGILYDLVDGANLADFTAAAADETLWSDVTCAIYGAIRTDGEVTAGNFAAVGAALNGLTYTHSEIPTALALFWGGVGVEAARRTQVAGALNLADCSGCGLDGAWGTQWQTGSGLDMCNGDWKPIVGGADGATSLCSAGVFDGTLNTAGTAYWVAIRVALSGVRTIDAVRMDMDAFGHDDTVEIKWFGVDGSLLRTSSGVRNWETGTHPPAVSGVAAIEIRIGMGGPTFFHLTNIDVGGPSGGTPFSVSNVAEPF